MIPFGAIMPLVDNEFLEHTQYLLVLGIRVYNTSIQAGIKVISICPNTAFCGLSLSPS